MSKTYFLKTALLATIALVGLTFTTTSHARIGENKGALEMRLLSKVNGAYQYTTIEDKLREALELPYKKMFLIFPSDVQPSFYFKRADTTLSVNGDTTQQHDLFGWEVNIQYQNSKSVMEFYRRHGDPMTPEELEALMLTMSASRDNAVWKKSNFVGVTQNWELAVKDGKIVEMARDKDGKLEVASKIPFPQSLPISTTRFVYLEVPQAVKSLVGYNQTIPAKYMEMEQRIAFENYRKYVEKQSAYSAAKTASGAKKSKVDSSIKVQRVNPSDGYTQRNIESIFTDIENSLKGGDKVSICKYNIHDVLFGGKPIAKIEKEVRITENIPLQPDTAFGFDFELSDGSLRAKIYRNAILFIDTQFDKQMREYMENLYLQQKRERESSAKESLNLF